MPTNQATQQSPLTAPDEYDFDSSDDEDIRNTVGNVPMHWYAKYQHIGYDTEGHRLMKPDTGDQLDDFMAKLDDPDYWRTVIDPKTGQRVVLSDEDVQLVKSIVQGRVPDPNVDPYEEQSDWFTSDKMVTPVTAHPPDKRSFVPSKWERLRVGRMVHAIKMGWMLTGEQREAARQQREAAAKAAHSDARFYDIWDQTEDADAIRRKLPYIRPPKKAPPTHYESYNPPEEFLFDDEELEKWRQQEEYERKVNFVPAKYAALRRVPAYPGYASELYERCQDLHLAARVVRHRVSMDPEDLLPKLPAPRDLRPFPHLRVLAFRAFPPPDGEENGGISACSVDPSGQWLAACDRAGRLGIFELTTGYRVWSAQLEEGGSGLLSVAWNPRAERPCIVAGGASGRLHLVATDRCDRLLASKFAEVWSATTEPASGGGDTNRWRIATTEERPLLAVVTLPAGHGSAKQVAWHSQGDYFLSVSESGALLVHRLSTRATQSPLASASAAAGKTGGSACCAAQFDPARPVLYVAEKARIQVYDLAKLTKLKTLRPNARPISCLSVHPSGSHLLAGSLDSRLAWFDLDLACTPYKQLRIHNDGVRQCCVHRQLPLSASVSDDGSCLVLHSRVYADLLENPLLVPVKRLRGHQIGNSGSGGGRAEAVVRVTACDFHPRLPWLVTGGSDGRIVLYSS